MDDLTKENHIRNVIAHLMQDNVMGFVVTILREDKQPVTAFCMTEKASDNFALIGATQTTIALITDHLNKEYKG